MLLLLLLLLRWRRRLRLLLLLVSYCPVLGVERLVVVLVAGADMVLQLPKLLAAHYALHQMEGGGDDVGLRGGAFQDLEKVVEALISAVVPDLPLQHVAEPLA